MSKVAITKELLDDLADAVSAKTGESVPLTIEDMTDAVEAITLRTGSDLSASGATVTVPAGLYSAQATKSIATGTEGTPTAVKGAVTNHSIIVTTSVTNTAGYISGGTHAGNAAQVFVSELESGTKSITENGTGISVSGYSTVDVAVAAGENVLVVTLSWDSTEEKWLPNKTYAEVSAAYTAGKTIVVNTTGQIGAVSADGAWDSTNSRFVYWAREYKSNGGYVAELEYFLTSNGVTLNSEYDNYDTSSATAAAAEVASGAVFFDANGYNEGTATRRTSSDLTASGATVTAPAGYYASNATYTLPTAEPYLNSTDEYFTDEGARRWHIRPFIEVDAGEGDVPGYIADGTHIDGNYTEYPAVPANTTITPTTSAQTVGGQNYMMEGPVTVAAMPSGTAGTPTATKGAVSNHAVSVTPSVTNQTGYITGSTINGAAVNVSASELVSGTLSVTSNGQQDVTNYQYIDVNVSGGSGSSIQADQVETELSSVSSSITFTGLQGEPTSFICYFDGGDLATGTPSKIAAIVFDGTSLHGQTITNTSNAQVSYDGSSFSKSYSNGSLTVTSTGASFQADYYVLDYTYDGTAGNIQTEDVQVGSGATSITFSNLEDEPIWWSCIFKSNFSTSNGYQRVIWTRDNGSNLTGMAMDSAAHSQQSWTSSYSNGSLTITSTGTNDGGYFHQPGYYQLTYAIASASPYEKVTKTYTPTTSQQTDTITPSTGYDAIDRVNVTIEAMPEMTLPSASSATSSGTSKATITPTSSAQYLNIPTGYNGTAQYYTIAASGGGGGSASIDTKTVTASNRPSSLSFTSMKGQPIAWFLKATFTMTSSSTTYYYVDSMRYDGTGVEGRLFQMGSTRQTMHVTTGYSASYSGTTLTISSTGNRTTSPGCFYNGSYELVYVY